MKRFLILSMVAIAMAAAPLTAGETTTYGDGVTLDEAVAIDTLLENPNDYVGRKVRVDGVITAVCKKRGCWMQVTDPDSGDGVRIKVEDGVIVIAEEAVELPLDLGACQADDVLLRNGDDELAVAP